MLLGHVSDEYYSRGYDAPGLFDPLVIFLNLYEQGHDAASEI